MEEMPILLILPAIILVLAVYYGCYYGWRGLKYLWLKEGEREQAELALIKSLRGKGIEPFAEAWVLTLSTEVPRITEAPASTGEYLSQLERDHGRASTAVRYFPSGKYLVNCDGSMRSINGNETVSPELLQVRAAIKIEELPHVDLIQRQTDSKPMNYVEARKKCTLLNVHAHGTAQRGERLRFHCTPQFAARDGRIVVESI